MLVLSADVRRAITAVLGRDRAAHVTAESAAAMHLGSAPLSPVVVAAQGPEPSPLVRIVPLPEVRATVLLEGLRVATVESTIVELCARPTRPLAALLAGDLLRRGFDGKSLVRIARGSSAAARRRVAFLLSRGGHEELARRVLPEERAGAVKLDPLGPAGGPMDGRTRVVVGVADGFSLPRDGERFVALVRAALGPRDKEIALLVGLGFPLIDPPAEAIERGLVSRAPDGWVPRPPFDEACARIDVDARARRRVIEGLARRDDPRCRVDAALLELDPEAGALRLSPEMASAIDGPRARAVVARLGERLGPESRRAFLERVGAWTEAAALVREGLKRSRGAARQSLVLHAAQIAWRRGRRREASGFLDELSRATDRGTRVQALLLRATLALESGAHGSAHRLLSRAMREADRELDRARALHRIGTLEARQGRPVEAAAAYRAALEALGEPTPETRALHGILQSNLAATASWLGRWDEAEELARQALAHKLVAGTSAEVVSTRVLLARIARARGEPVPPSGRVPPLIDDVERTGDARLRVEAFLDLAEELAREDDLSAAERALERARAALLSLDASEPILDALFAHVDGLLRGLSGDVVEGLSLLEQAARRFDRLHGSFWSARARRDAASLLDATGREDEALETLREVARSCEKHRFVLGEDETHLPLLALAATRGGEGLKAWAERGLSAIGAERARARLLSLGLAARADALRDRPLGKRLLRGVPGMVVLDGTTMILPDGARVSLSRRRLLLPLLLALATGEAVTLDDLSRRVWDRRDASARAAVKMSISRLRAVLGPLGDRLLSSRVGGALAYSFPVPVRIVRPA